MALAFWGNLVGIVWRKLNGTVCQTLVGLVFEHVGGFVVWGVRGVFFVRMKLALQCRAMIIKSLLRYWLPTRSLETAENEVQACQ